MTEQERYNKLVSTKIGSIISDEFKEYLLREGFFRVPASTKYHGAYEGGLFDHSLTVMAFLVELSVRNAIKWQREESPFIVGMFHDLCKIDQYCHPIVNETLTGKPVYDSNSWEYNKESLFKGHGDKSIMLLSQHIVLTEEEALCIRYHMGAFTEKSEWGDYTNAIHKYPTVLWTHHADMLASHVAGI